MTRKEEKFWKNQLKSIKEESEIEDIGGEDPAVETERHRQRLCFSGFDERKFGLSSTTISNKKNRHNIVVETKI